MGRKKLKLDLTRTSIYIEKKQLEWVERNHFNLSSLVRSYLRELMPAIDSTKNLLVPVYIKNKSESTFRRRAKKNPRLKEVGLV